jgi:hypothetical protein
MGSGASRPWRDRQRLDASSIRRDRKRRSGALAQELDRGSKPGAPVLELYDVGEMLVVAGTASA